MAGATDRTGMIEVHSAPLMLLEGVDSHLYLFLTASMIQVNDIYLPRIIVDVDGVPIDSENRIQ